MKKKAFIAFLGALAFLWPTAALAAPAKKTTSDDINKNFGANSLYTTEGKLRLSSEPTDQDMVDNFINMVVEKGGEAITSGISVYAKCVVLNLLKECGLDLRDATTKTLEKIQSQLNIIEQKVEAIIAKQEEYHSQDILNGVLDPFLVANKRYMRYITGNMAYLAGLEQEDSMSEEEIEKERIQAFYDGIDKLVFDGAPFATEITILASKVLQPNQADPRKDIFYYYDQTMGLYDKWDVQYYRNVKNFIAYLDGTLILLSDLAKFQIYYMAKDASEGMRRTYVQQIEDMAEAVNAVNAMFANKLESMDDILYQLQRGYNKYRPTGTSYGTRMCTLTYNLNDKGWGDSRQALLLDYYNDYGRRGAHQVSYCYQPNQDIVESVANDFREFAGDYCTPAYTIQTYLTNAGFWAKNADLWDKANGLFMGDMYVDQFGFMHDDKDYSFRYYDKWGVHRRSNAYSVATYHTWYGGVKYTELRGNDENYYLCFTSMDSNGYWRLAGSYKETYMYDLMFTVNEKVYYKVDYKEFLYGKPGPVRLHDWW